MNFSNSPGNSKPIWNFAQTIDYSNGATILKILKVLEVRPSIWHVLKFLDEANGVMEGDIL